jgi:hypothetical protein
MPHDGSRQALPTCLGYFGSDNSNRSFGFDGSARRVTKSKKQVAVMTRVLLVGYDPETMDFSNPPLPPGTALRRYAPVCDGSFTVWLLSLATQSYVSNEGTLGVKSIRQERH